MPNFTSKNNGQWFYFDPDNEKLGGVCLRELPPDEFDRIEKLTVRHKKKIMKGVLIDDVKVDEKLASKLRWDFCITGWKVVSLDGKLLECNSENKIRMMKVTDFVKFVADSLSELVEVNKSLDEARVKNLEDSSDDNSTSPTAKTV